MYYYLRYRKWSPMFNIYTLYNQFYLFLHWKKLKKKKTDSEYILIIIYMYILKFSI